MGHEPAGFTRQLLETVARVVSVSRFYANKFAAAGIEIGALRSLNDFQRLPLTRKSEIPDAQCSAPPFGTLLAVSHERIASIGISPGPIYIPRTASEPTGIESLHESFRRMGVRDSDIAHVTLSYHIMPGGLRLHRAFESYGCRVINGGVGNSELQVRVASDLGATVYAGTPSFLAHLADVAEQEQRKLRYRVGFSTAETLTPQIREEMRRKLGIELFNHCGEALIGPLAGECRLHDGMHLHSRDMFVEFLDPDTGEPVQPGGVGEVVITQLGERAMPLIRYAPGDLFHLRNDPCACGDSSRRVDFLGQVGTIKKVRGVLVHPAQIRAALASFPDLGNFQLIIDHAADSRYDRARIRIGCDKQGDLAPLRARIAERIKANVLIQMDVELVPKSQIAENGIVDQRSR